MANNVAEFVLRITTEGKGDAQALAGQLTQLDQIGKQTAGSMVSAATAQRAYTVEITQTNSRLVRLTQDWGNLQGQVDQFTAHTLRDFASTSAHVLTQWIEGTANAKQAFTGFVASVIEGIIQIMIQQTIAHALGIGLTQAAATTQTAANAEITASAAPAAATEAAATFGANSVGVALVIAAVLAGIGALIATSSHHAAGGPIYGPGGETGDSIPAWLSHNEFVQPASAHRFYGTDVMEALRTHQIPRDRLRELIENRTFSVGSPPAPSHAFASGGIAVRLAAGGIAVSPRINVEPPPALFGDDAIEAWLASSAGQRALDRHLESRTHRLARHLKRAGGNRES